MKQKHWKVSVFDKTSETIKNDTFYTTDTEAYLVFELIDEDFTPDSAMVTVYNIYGKATINASAEIVDGIVQYEMPENAIGHPGGWRTQVIYTKDNEDYTTKIIEFDVGGHLLDNKKPAIVDIENWNNFIAHAGELIDDWEQLEEIRQVNEQQRELAESARQNEFETNETTRQSEFETNETSRQTNELVREEAENNRQSTFETNEAERESTFEINESGRQANEQGRESAESERVANEAERISKDGERDSKINSKANKSMLLSPKYDLIYDSCVRDVDTPLDAYSVPMESGHYFVNVGEREVDTMLTYEPEGVIFANPAEYQSFSPVIIDDFEVIYPYINVRFNNVFQSAFMRFFYIKYLNKQNWIRVDTGTNLTTITTCIDGVETEIGRNFNPLNNDFGERYGLVQDIHISYRRVHSNASPSLRAVVVRQGDRESFVTSVPVEVANLFDNQGKVGFEAQGQTEILNFKAGSVK